MHLPHIGTTVFTTPEEVKRAWVIFIRAGGFRLELPHRLGIGVMAGHGALDDVSSDWKRAFPRDERVAALFTSMPGLFNILHYVDHNRQTRLEDLEQAVGLGGAHLHALQLDMLWPDAELLRRFRERHPTIFTILQMNPLSVEIEGDGPVRVARRLRFYGDSLDGILLNEDPDGDRELGTERLLAYLQEIMLTCPDLNPAVAGGLGPETLHLLQPIVDGRRNAISINARTKLYLQHDRQRSIDWAAVERYIHNSVQLFSS